MKQIAGAMALVTAVASTWLWSLSRRPIEMMLGDSAFTGGELRVTTAISPSRVSVAMGAGLGVLMGVSSWLKSDRAA